ncbi:MAG: amino acid adenylation domain-containing protein [Deltaproteobacteria bacterium]|nr:amino acid adenylation domain-containing protein [Deltaproteobacteria bacterium]
MSGLEDRIAALPPQARRLLELRLGKAGLQMQSPRSIPPAAPAEHYPLSFGQQRLWFLNELLPGIAAYNIPFAGHLEGRLQTALLEASLNEVIRRHEVLRSRFYRVEGQAVQQVVEPEDVALRLVDLRGLPEAARDKLLECLPSLEARCPFDYHRAPLLRLTLFRLAGHTHFLQVTLPHIVTDAWSTNLFFRELPAIYNALLEGRPSPLEPLAIQVKDHAVWQRGELTEARRKPLLDFWKQQMEGAPTILDLPSDRPRPPRQSYQGRRHPLFLPPRLASRVESFRQRRGATAFMTFLAIYGTLLHRVTGQQTLLVGSPAVTREPEETHDLIGFFINTVVLRLDFQGRPTFEEMMVRVREVCLSAFAHQELPFQDLVELFWRERSLARAPLTQATFVLQNVHISPPRLRGLELTQFQQTPTLTARDDLLLGLWETGDTPEGWLEYNTDIFDRSTIERMAGHFLRLLEGALEDPRRPLDELPMASVGERQQLLREWNDSHRPYPSEATLTALVKRQIETRPQEIALQSDTLSLTYGDLDRQAQKLANRLARAGVTADTVVALTLEPGPELVVAMLAVLRAGGAYLPIDPQEPPARFAVLLAEAWRQRLPSSPAVVVVEDLEGCSKILHQPPAALAAVFPEGLRLLPFAQSTNDEEVALDSSSSSPSAPGRSLGKSPRAPIYPQSLAYVLFTSGSTGEPKGVAVTHHSIVRMLLGMPFSMTSREVMLQLAPAAFDASTFEIWGCLTHGAKLVFPRQRKLTLPQLEAEVHRHGVTTLWLTTALFHLVAASGDRTLTTVDRVLTGGETLQPALLRQGLATGDVTLVHCYGPTEAVTFTTCRRFRDPSEVGDHASIGKPLGNTSTYVLGPHLEAQPVGVPGQLWIGGDALARGYSNQPAATAASFVPNPFSRRPGRRLYRTGDAVRWRTGGELEFLHRLDHQIKVRGFRVEPAEVAAALASHPAITGVEITAPTDLAEAPGQPRLVAYLTTRHPYPNAAELRQFLADRLPKAFIPSHFLFLEAFPLKANGKVDHDALPKPQGEKVEARVSPSSEIERRLAAIWADLLGRESIGVEENFFEIGGDSILSIQALGRAAEEGIHLEVEDVFNHPTVSSLAAQVSAAENRSGLTPATPGPVPLTPLQTWFTERCGPHPSHWNLGLWCSAESCLEQQLLERAVRHLIARHEALRLRLSRAGGSWWQELVHDPPTPLVDTFDLSHLAPEDIPQALAQGCVQVNRGLDLEAGQNLRLGLFELGPEEPQRLLLVTHHAVADTVSCALLVEQLDQIYGCLEKDEEISEGPTRAGFAAWARQLASLARDADLDSLSELWSPPRDAQFPATLQGESEPESEATTLFVPLGEDLSSALLEEAPAAYGTRPEEILLTALVETLGDDQGSLPVMLESHGRDGQHAVDLSSAVGWFTSLYPVYLDLRHRRGAGERMLAVKEQVRQVRRRPQGTVGFGLLRRFASTPPELPQGVSFNYLGRLDGILEGCRRLQILDEPVEPLRDGQGLRPQVLEVTVFGRGPELVAAWTYSRGRHQRSQIDTWGEEFRDRLQVLVNHCLDPSAGGVSPADFPHLEIDEGDLGRILEQLDSGNESQDGDGQ